MTTNLCTPLSVCRHRGKPSAEAIDETVTLRIAGTHQSVRLCAARAGLPPVLVVQAGPGFPLLNEVAKYQQRLALERDFTVAYWEQRGCGRARAEDGAAISLETQVEDLGAVLRWLKDHTQQEVVVLGISLGATFALQAAAREPGLVKSVVAVSVDTDLPAADAAAWEFLQQVASKPRRSGLARAIRKLGPPPYTDPARFQLRARLLTELGGIEHGRRFLPLLRELLLSLVRSHGLSGTLAALRNMNALQRRLLPALASLDLLADWPRPSVPVHYVFGNRDPLVPRAVVDKLTAFASDRDTVQTLADAGHMVHFDQAAAVRALVVRAHAGDTAAAPS